MTASQAWREELRADCSACVGLCCVALPFARSADFAFDKPAGMPCPHLRRDDRCSIHRTLRAEGFSGCDAYDCFGAGQQVTQVTFDGASWRDGDGAAAAMFAAFAVLRAVHEMRWYLADASTRDLDPPLSATVSEAATNLRRISEAGPREVALVDARTLRQRVGVLLSAVSAAVRAGHGGAHLRGADLAGRDLRRTRLRAADLRGSLLLGADLRGADLRRSDLLAADLRGAVVRGADLSDALFVTRPQLAAADGDRATRIPSGVERPAHWGCARLEQRL